MVHTRHSLFALPLFGLFGCAALPAFAGFTVTPLTGNSDSGISVSKTYTHAVDFNGSGETINGVVFAAGGGSSQPSLNYDLVIANANGTTGGAYSNNSNNLGGSLNQLASDFYYNQSGQSSPYETLTLSGLTAGTTYTTVFYNVGFGSVGERTNTITDGLGDTINYDENMYGMGNGSELINTYTATSGSVTYTFIPDNAEGASFHQYGFSNEVDPSPAPEPAQMATLSLIGLGLGGLILRARKRQSPVTGNA